MASIGKLAGQTAIYGLGTILPKVLNFAVLTFLYTRVFDKEVYGTVTEIYAYVVMIMVILTFGMETGFFRFCRGEKNIRKVYTHAFTFVFILTLIWVIIVQLFIDPIAEKLRYDAHPEYILWFAWIIALDALISIPFAKLRQQERPLRFAVLRLSMVVLNIVLVIVFLVLFPWLHELNGGKLPGWIYDPEMGVGYVFIANLATSLLSFLLILPELKDLKWGFDIKLMIKMLRFSSPLVLVGIAGAINDVADKIFLKFLTPDAATAMGSVGEYGANYRIAVLMTLYIQMFRYAFEPFLFEISGEKDAQQTYARVMRYFVIIGLMIFLGVTFYMDGVQYFLGKDFRGGVGIVPIVLFANLLLGIYYSLSVWYKVTDKTIYASVIALSGTVVTIMVNVIFIPVYGYWASAWATLACYFLMVVISFFWGQRVYKVPYQVGNILSWIGLALVLFGISFFLRPEILLWRLLFNTGLMMVFVIILAVREKELVRVISIRLGLK